MSTGRIAIALAVVGLLASGVFAQVIQQPSLGVNTVRTTVVVPDRGQALLGGFNRAREGRQETGVPFFGKLPFFGRGFKNVGIGRDVSSSNFTVRPYIFNFDEMEEALLHQASARRGGAAIAGMTSPSPFGGLARTHDEQRLESVADIRQRQKENKTEQEKLAGFYRRGLLAEKKGKPHIAKIYFRIVASQADGQLLEKASARLEKLTGKSTARKTAARKSSK